MSVARRLGAFALSLILPPLGAALARGTARPGVRINILGFVLAHGVFWGLAALPGLALYLLVVAQACWLSLWPMRTDKETMA